MRALAVKSFFLLHEPSSVLTPSPWIHSQCNVMQQVFSFLSSIQPSILCTVYPLIPVQPHREGEKHFFFPSASLSVPATTLCNTELVTDHSHTVHVFHKDLHYSRCESVSTWELCSTSCVQCHKAGQGQEEEKNSVKVWNRGNQQVWAWRRVMTGQWEAKG